jgi:hypothetical protein
MFTRVMPAERAVRDAANVLKRAAQERERVAHRTDKEQAEFRRTPVGQARAAFERGDRVFQCALDVERQDAVIVSEILDAVAREGWEPVSASFVSCEQGPESRDTTMGYYLFRRAAHHRQSSAGPSS